MPPTQITCVQLPLLTTEQYAYIAGMIDGEGCVTNRRCQSKYKEKIYESRMITLCITNTNLGCLEKIKQWLGYGKIFANVRSKDNPHWKTCYRLVFSPFYLRFLLPNVIPFLIIKKNKAEEIYKILLGIKHTKRHINAKDHSPEYNREYERLAKRQRKDYYKQRYQDPILRAKKLLQIYEYKKRRKLNGGKKLD